MDKIKAFLHKKKLDAKFKKLGSGHKLSVQNGSPENVASSAGPSVMESDSPVVRTYTAADPEQAAQAALKRLQISQAPKTTSRTAQSVKAEAKRQIAAENRLRVMEQTSDHKNADVEHYFEAAPVLAVSGVYFTCELLGEELRLTKRQMQEEVEEFLRRSLVDDDPVVASAIMIHSLNGVDREKRQASVETIGKYLQNIIHSPNEDKYRRIKKSNRVFQEKIASLKGGLEFLMAVGFVDTVEDGETFLILPKTSDDVERLKLCYDCLENGEPVPLRLYRDPKILQPNQIDRTLQIDDSQFPAEFFQRSPHELLKEQEEKKKQLEKMGQLRTKEMRERDEMRALYKYKYCLIRIRFPDGLTLQGTFGTAEPLSHVESFVREYLICDWAIFILKESHGVVLSTERMSDTLAELSLTPAATLHFEWEPDFLADCRASGQSLPQQFLKDL